MPDPHRRPRPSLPRSVWALGLVSLFTDISSELVHALLPVFLSTVLGASMIGIGLLEGVAEATASITKVFSGALSDRWRRRKAIVVFGYGLSALTKPVFALAGSVATVFAARFVDRIGKGIRGAPRDALLADLVTAEQRGAAYGLRQSLDSVGAFVGPLLAIVLMAALADDLRAVLAFATIPAAVSVFLLLVGVHEPEIPRAHTARPLGLSLLGELPRAYWIVVALAAVFSLARFSEAFLVLRALDAGLAIGYVPAVMIVMNLLYAGAAYPVGLLADRVGERGLLLLGLIVLVIAEIVLALASTGTLVLTGAALWGLHLGLTQGLLAKLVADTSKPELRATAFGIFHLVGGVALLVASVLAGVLWETLGPAATFAAGAGFALVAAVGFGLLRPART